MLQMPAVAALVEAAQAHQLKQLAQQPFVITPALQDFFLYSGKQCPHIYLQPQVRAGISSFQNFCSEAELEQGLTALAADIASGQIEQIMARSDATLSDYVFLALKKPER